MVKKSKRAQGMPINVIIIAALALIVLVVLAVIFTGRVKIFSESLQSCAAKQGSCEQYRGTQPKCPSSNQAVITNTDCEKNKVCCIQVFDIKQRQP